MNKDFETLEKIAVHMADNIWPDYQHKMKAEKLKEEMDELIDELTGEDISKMISNGRNIVLKKGEYLNECELDFQKVKDEMADVLFVLLQMANRMGFTGYDLIHHATTKLLRRINDPCYNKD